MDTYTGFIYLWHDLKRNMWYIGSHMGSCDDSYVCSSRWMMTAYKRRPDTFRRRILEYCDGSRAFLYEREAKWLAMIKEGELSKKYYNRNRNAMGLDPTKIDKELRDILSKNHSDTMRQKWADPIFHLKMVKARRKQNNAWNTHPEKMKEANRKANVGRKVSDETKKKMREAALRRITPEWAASQAQKMRDVRLGRKGS